MDRNVLRRVLRAPFFYAASALPGHPARPPVLIFAQGRSGSTLLESLLASTGHFASRGELLGEGHERLRWPAAFLRGQARWTGSRAMLCHVKLYHLTRDRARASTRPVEPRAFLHELHRQGGRIIHLNREDRIRHVLSGLVAEARQNYHKLDDRPEQVRVHVKRATLEGWVRQRQALECAERAALAGLPVHEIVYERDLEDAAMHQRTIDRVLDHLGLPRRAVSTPLRKINARPLNQIVANYDEFAGWVTAMGMGDLLAPETLCAATA